MLNPKTGKKWKVYVATPSTGRISDFQPYVLRDLVDRYGDEVELVHPTQLCQRIFHDAARQGLIADFLTTDCDIIWFLDSDVCPQKHVLDLVAVHGDKWQCAGAPYPVFMSQPGQDFRQVVMTVYKGISGDNKKLAPSTCPYEGTDWVDGLATGCLMIKREVFDKLEQPYFEFKYDPITRAPIEGEDIGFCLKMAQLGIKFFVDYSMVCKHFKDNIDLLEMNNYCIDFANKCVSNYDKTVRSNVDLLNTKFRSILEENKRLKEELSSKRSSLVSASGKPLIYR